MTEKQAETLQEKEIHIVRDTECGGHIDESGDERKKSIRVADETVCKHMEPGFEDVRI